MKKAKLLLVEDDQGFREQLKWALNEDYQVLEADSFVGSVDVFQKEGPTAVCLDMKLENRPQRGLEIIDSLISLNRRVKIIVITGSNSKTLGQKAIEKGACDYLTKPIDINELKVLLSRAFRVTAFEESASYRSDTHAEFEEPVIVGKSRAVKHIIEQIKRVSTTDVSVLITGESGTGKDLCAHAIHYYSPRKNDPFIPINCGAIPESLMESELFGYVKGAFTGANSDKIGLLESANHGTVFLDEIGDIPRNHQVKLLRFLQDMKIQRVGDVHSQKLDVRIIAATNNAPSAITKNGTLRNDLYYRLSEFEIHIPSLRERKEDIIPLAKHIIEIDRVRFNHPELRISKKAQNRLMNYPWPGNIRELKNRLNRASINCHNQVIEEEDLDFSPTTNQRCPLTDTKRLLEKDTVLDALKMTNHNITQAAKRIGVSRPTLYRLVNKHHISVV